MVMRSGVKKSSFEQTTTPCFLWFRPDSNPAGYNIRVQCSRMTEELFAIQPLSLLEVCSSLPWDPKALSSSFVC